jgi:SAM-dependent methyltransferase
MESYGDETYGEGIAEVYDQFYEQFYPASIDLLLEFAAGGRALELGIGTGRIALPLLEKGIKIHGIDASEAMLAKLRAKSSGTDIKVKKGSFENFQIDERFNLIYVVFNTFFALLTQEAQVKCFQSVAKHLSPDGVFLIEAFVPNLARFDQNQTVRATQVSEKWVHLEVSQHNPILQQSTSQLVLVSDSGIQLYPVKIRYAWPAELDLMARLAGLSLVHRWGSWTKDVFNADSKSHISVYGFEN